MNIRNGEDYHKELMALQVAAVYAANRADELKAEAERLGVLAKTALSIGFADPGVTSMQGRAEKIRILHNDIGNALSEIELQVNSLD
jgi:hypothetical protein